MTNNQFQGLKWATLTMVISGFSVFFNSLVVKGIDPLVHTTVKNSMVGMMILFLLVITGEGKKMRQLKGKDRLKLMLIGIVGGSVAFYLFFAGLKMIGGVQGSMIHKTLIFWVAIAAVPLLGEKMSMKMTVGVLLLYFSNLAVGFEGFSNIGRGHLMVLAATVLWASENLIAKNTLKEVPANIVVAARMGFGSLILIGMLFVSGKAPLVMELTGKQWSLLFGMALLLLFYVMTWYRALKLAPATFVASVLVGATVITSLLDAAFVSHTLGTPQLGQAVLILAGIWLVLMAMMDEWGREENSKLKLQS
jgi:drug/metabolite transporter (DMT)-like permease